MAKRKKGSGGSFATKFLGPTTGGRGRGPNYGSTRSDAGKRRRKGSAIVPGGITRRKG